jgi:hypothetical protein
MIAVAVEETTDYQATARLATEAFASTDVVFDPEHLRWLYERCFGMGTTVVSLTDEVGRKVGQIALVKQSVLVNGVSETAAELIDLFLVREWRGSERVQMLYDEVGREFVRQNLRFAFGMPNAKAMPVNERFFNLKGYLKLDIRVGLATPLRSSRVVVDEAFDRAREQHFVSLFDRYATDKSETGVPWDGASLYRRLTGQKFQYAIHATDDVLLISSLRRKRFVPYVLMCAYLRRRGTTPLSADVNAVTRAASAFWRWPFFVYAGLNKTLPIPGLSLPEKLRPSPMLLQVRDFAPERAKLEFDRFQLIDFDFA